MVVRKKYKNIHHKKIAHTHAAECRYTFNVVHAQYYIWQMNKQYKKLNKLVRNNDKQWAYSADQH